MEKGHLKARGSKRLLCVLGYVCRAGPHLGFLKARTWPLAVVRPEQVPFEVARLLELFAAAADSRRCPFVPILNLLEAGLLLC